MPLRVISICAKSLRYASMRYGYLCYAYLRYASLWEARWPHGYFARPRSERSGFEPGTLCCVLGQHT